MDIIVLIVLYAAALLLGYMAMRVDVYLDRSHGIEEKTVKKNFRMGMLAVFIGAGIWLLIIHLLMDMS